MAYVEGCPCKECAEYRIYNLTNPVESDTLTSGSETEVTSTLQETPVEPVYKTMDDIVRAIAIEVTDEAIAKVPQPEFDFATIADDVYEKAEEAIADQPDVQDVVEEGIQNWVAYEMDISEQVESALQDALPYGWDWDEVQNFAQNFDPRDFDLVTDCDLSSFREEIEEAIEKVATPESDPDAVTVDTVAALEDRISELEGQLEAVLNRLDEAQVTI